VELYNNPVSREVIEEIIKHERYIRYIHDYDQNSLIDVNDTIRPRLLQNSVVNFFLSPLHRQTYFDLYNISLGVSELAPPYVDHKRFVKFNDKREDRVIALGEFALHKGAYEVFKWAEKNKTFVDYYTWAVTKDLDYGYVTMKPKINYEELHFYLNKYKTLLHLPNWNEPFGRVFAEAFLCGTKIVTNQEKSGFHSWHFKDRAEYIKQVELGTTKFWSYIK
jgi:glycosyltransferase involved in cell wall biosynthesis